MSLSIFNSKKRVLKGIYLLLFSIILFILLDRFIYILYRKTSNSFYNRPPENTINRKISKTEKSFYNTLVMGSSRTRHSIHPWYLNKYLGLKAKKIAASGKYPRYHFRYYKMFKEKYRIPEYIIYGVDYFMFDRASNLKKMKRLLGFELNKKHKKPFKVNIGLFSPFPYPSLLVRDKEKINDFYIDVLDEMIKKHLKSTGQSLIDERKGSQRTADPENLREPVTWEKIPYRPFPGIEGKFFKLLLDEFDKDGVRVFIVIIPDILGVYETNYERNLFVKDISDLCKEYSNISILNYNKPDKFDLKNNKFFIDGKYGEVLSHISFLGSEIFNKMLCDDIKKIIER